MVKSRGVRGRATRSLTTSGSVGEGHADACDSNSRRISAPVHAHYVDSKDVVAKEEPCRATVTT